MKNSIFNKKIEMLFSYVLMCRKREKKDIRKLPKSLENT